jgi:hypothetical protein
MDYRGQTAVLSAILVLVGMMFLVHAITEKALAVIHATAKGVCGKDNPPYTTTRPCEFSLFSDHLDVGQWTSQPTQYGTVVTWSTKGYCVEGCIGDEKGSVTYRIYNPLDMKVQTRAVLSFENPLIGSNKCGVGTSGGGLEGDCTAGKGMNADFTYNLRWPQVAICEKVEPRTC